jgi:hypothetical protein
LLGIALCMSSAALAQAPDAGVPAGPPKAAPYDCFGLAGVALRSCIDLNAAAADAGKNTPSTSHDCGGMTGAALATCRELNGEILAPPTNSSNPGGYGSYGTPGYVAPGMAPGNIPATNANPATGAGSSSGSNPTGLSGGSGRLASGNVAPGSSTAGTSSNSNSSGGGKSAM